MKGDFSRNTFHPTKHYRAVLKQQGRVDVDADWNEQQAINLSRIEMEATDVIGACGAPLHDAGFAITFDANGVLRIGAGRYQTSAGVGEFNGIASRVHEFAQKSVAVESQAGGLPEWGNDSCGTLRAIACNGRHVAAGIGDRGQFPGGIIGKLEHQRAGQWFQGLQMATGGIEHVDFGALL